MLVWMPSSSGGACTPMSVDDDRTPVTTLRDELRVAEALHQHGPGTRNASGVPPGRGRLAGKPVSRASTESPYGTRPTRFRH